jgi:hypothetical protein
MHVVAERELRFATVATSCCCVLAWLWHTLGFDQQLQPKNLYQVFLT